MAVLTERGWYVLKVLDSFSKHLIKNTVEWEVSPFNAALSRDS